MGRRGPIPRPDSSETARGRNTFARKGPKLEPAFGLKPPASVSARPAAIRFWKLHAPTLIADCRLRAEHVETFGLVCRLFADIEQLEEQLGQEGWITATDKGQAISPVARLLREARHDFLAAARDFGLTAASAARLPQDVTDGKEDDEEAALLKRFTGRSA
jgi:phage terminase small subunit